MLYNQIFFHFLKKVLALYNHNIYNTPIKTRKLDKSLNSLLSDWRHKMKKIEMLEISQNRQNLTAFLHVSESKVINANLVDTNVDKKTFDEICSIVLDQYENKQISNKQASEIFETLAKANKSFKIEKFRCVGNEIYQYSQDHQAYLFYSNGGQRKFNKLIKENGRFL